MTFDQCVVCFPRACGPTTDSPSASKNQFVSRCSNESSPGVVGTGESLRQARFDGALCLPESRFVRQLAGGRPVTFVLPSADADGLAPVVRARVEVRRRGE